jgi:hypothetical protein
MSQFSRQQQRDSDLRNGADADLVAANNRRWKLYLIFSAVLVGVYAANRVFHPTGWVHSLVYGAYILVLVVGYVAGQWWWQEKIFLHKPDPKEPPKIFP